MSSQKPRQRKQNCYWVTDNPYTNLGVDIANKVSLCEHLTFPTNDFCKCNDAVSTHWSLYLFYSLIVSVMWIVYVKKNDVNFVVFGRLPTICRWKICVQLFLFNIR